MIIKSIQLKNFRCILDAKLNCEPLIAIVGANGCGKSSLLRALELFYSSSPRFNQDDFYNGDTNNDIEISVTFTELEEEALKLFDPYVDRQTLTVTRVLSLRGEKLTAKFHGTSLQNPDFVQVREAGSATAVRQKYTELKQKSEYSNLPAATSQTAVLDSLRQWELAHPEKSTRLSDDGQFFGFTEVAQGYLGRFTRLISIPAVRDAAEDADEGKGRPITEILDLVVRATLASNEELKQLREQTQKKYDEIMTVASTAQLADLGVKLTTTLRTYVPDSEVKLNWITGGGVGISLPKADLKLVEHGYSTPVSRAGHGLQRAFIMTMLQHLTATQAQIAEKKRLETTGGPESQPQETSSIGPFTPIPSLVLAIEEPELYQHPNRQRHLAGIFLKLANGTVPGVARKTQIIYSSHSPLFVGMDRFNQVRVLRKVANGSDVPKITKVIEVGGNEVAEALWEACDRKDQKGNDMPKYTWESLKPHLEAIMTPWMAEGFFADTVVLVEGEDDRAAILGMALSKGREFEGLGISVIPSNGKASLDRPFLIFSKFGIPVYLMWDSDRNSNPREQEKQIRTNRILLRLVGAALTDWPSEVQKNFACFETKLEDTMRSEIGIEKFDSILADSQVLFGYSSKGDTVKNPYLLRDLLQRARQQGATCGTLESIVDAIVKLRDEKLVIP